jgi:hypothetical protein
MSCCFVFYVFYTRFGCVVYKYSEMAEKKEARVFLSPFKLSIVNSRMDFSRILS